MIFQKRFGWHNLYCTTPHIQYILLIQDELVIFFASVFGGGGGGGEVEGVGEGGEGVTRLQRQLDSCHMPRDPSHHCRS